jgi:hypothetical protein
LPFYLQLCRDDCHLGYIKNKLNLKKNIEQNSEKSARIVPRWANSASTSYIKIPNYLSEILQIIMGECHQIM